MAEKTSTPLPARSKADTPKVESVTVQPVTRLAAWPKSVKPADQDSGQLTDKRKDELVAKAEEAGVDTTGTKADIIERIETPAEAPVVENVTEAGVPETRTGDTTISESHAAARAADR